MGNDYKLFPNTYLLDSFHQVLTQWEWIIVLVFRVNWGILLLIKTCDGSMCLEQLLRAQFQETAQPFLDISSYKNDSKVQSERICLQHLPKEQLPEAAQPFAGGYFVVVRHCHRNKTTVRRGAHEIKCLCPSGGMRGSALVIFEFSNFPPRPL